MKGNKKRYAVTVTTWETYSVYATSEEEALELQANAPATDLKQTDGETAVSLWSDI